MDWGLRLKAQVKGSPQLAGAGAKSDGFHPRTDFLLFTFKHLTLLIGVGYS